MRCSTATLCGLALFVCAVSAPIVAKTITKATPTPVPSTVSYAAEVLLIDVYKKIGAGQSKEALKSAQKLVSDFPNFQLGQLVYGDLLTMQGKPVQTLGDVPMTITGKSPSIAKALADLRFESAQRIKALRDRPAPDTFPSQFLSLSLRNKHAIAVDASKSRLYLFQNSVGGLKLIADYYITLGESGIGKYQEGDNKTPLGVYYLTAGVDPKTLPPLYGGGALPINYPNPLDLRLGKTGSGIWLHGTPPERYARQPYSSNGCVVLSNPDLNKIISTVAIRTTPVVIAAQLQWITPAQLDNARKQFDVTWNAWQQAKQTGKVNELYSFYMADFNNYGRKLGEWWQTILQEIKSTNGRGFHWREVTTLAWHPDATNRNSNVVVVTFDEAPTGKAFVTRRQYWMQANGQWKLFFEGTINQ